MLEQLLQNIQETSTNKTKLDVDFFDIDIKYRSRANSIPKPEYILYKLENNLTELLKSNSIILPENKSIIEVPKMLWPDFTISIKNIYDLSDKSKSLPDLAKYTYDILVSQNINYISKIELKWIFINIYTDDNYKAEILKQISQFGANYGNVNINWFSDKNIITEFPSCNMSKAMWVHHVRSMVIWQVWSNIVAKTWAKLLTRNYLGDRGTPFGKLVYSIEYFSQKDKNLLAQIESKPNEILWQLYADFKNILVEEKEDIARNYFARLENGDENMIALRKYIRKLSLKDFDNLFAKFDVHPDTDIWESYSQTYDSQIINDLQNANLLHESQWALITKFIRQDGELIPLKVWENEPEDKSSMEFFIIKKSDWSTNYATRDLWLMKLRWENHADKIYIPTDNGQKLHFQLVKILAVRLWYISPETFTHIPFGLLLSSGEKMSTRWGKLFRLEDLINEITDKIKSDFGERIDNQTAEKLAISAIIFNDIKWDINKDINFDIDMMTKTSGDSGIYLQYSKSRINSIITKLGELQTWTSADMSVLSNIYANDKAISDLVVKLSYISEIYSDSISLVKPHIIVQYILWICWDLNSRYNNWPKILDLDAEQQACYKYILSNIYICLENLFATIHLPKIDRV